jgi:putative ABC transport system substrate-binding protein
VILGTAASIVRDLQEASRTIPIVFVTTIDPVGSGLVASLAHPGGNATGFTSYDFSLSAKLLELLKQIAPNVTRVAVLRDPFGTGRRRRICCDPDCGTRLRRGADSDWGA